MSAFILNTEVIEKIASMLTWGELHGIEQRYRQAFQDVCHLARVYGDKDDMSRGHVAWGLLKLNYDSVNARYKDEDQPEEQPLVDNALPLRGIKALWLYDNLRCYTYQSCEGDCSEEPLYKAIEKLIALLASHLVDTYRPEPVKWGEV